VEGERNWAAEYAKFFPEPEDQDPFEAPAAQVRSDSSRVPEIRKRHEPGLSIGSQTLRSAIPGVQIDAPERAVNALERGRKVRRLLAEEAE